MAYVVLCSGLEYPAKMEEKLSQHDIASYTAKRHQLVCWQASGCWCTGARQHTSCGFDQLNLIQETKGGGVYRCRDLSQRELGQ